MASILKYVVSIVSSFVLFQCSGSYVQNSVNGNGPVIQYEVEYEEVGSFVFERGWEVVLIPSSSNKVFIEANENLIQDELVVSEKNGVLKISAERNIRKADKKRVEVYYTATIEELKANSGASVVSREMIESKNININSSSGSRMDLQVIADEVHANSSSGSVIELKLNSDELTVNSSSGSSIRLIGESYSLKADASSGSAINGKEFKAKEAKLKSTSGSNITLEVEEKADANASSGSSINILGEPKEVSKSTSSGASVRS